MEDVKERPRTAAAAAPGASAPRKRRRASGEEEDAQQAHAPPAAGGNDSSGPAQPRPRKPHLKSVEELTAAMEAVKRQRMALGTLSQAQKLDIIYLYLALKREKAIERSEVGDGVAPGNFSERVRELTGYGGSTIGHVWKVYTGSRTVEPRKVRANLKGGKEPRVASDRATLERVRDFIRERRAAGEFVTAKDVLELLLGSGRLALANPNDAKERRAALRAVQRYLQRRGFQRAVRADGWRERDEVLIARARFLDGLKRNRELRELREVFVGEAVVGAAGARVAILAALIGPDPGTIRSGSGDVDAVLLMDAVEVVDLQRGDDGAGGPPLSAKTFLRWFDQRLLPALRQRCQIVMDGGSVLHVERAPALPPPATLDRARLEAELTALKVPFRPTQSLVMLRALLEDALAHEPLAVQKSAHAKGHAVLLAPPHHTSLLPTESLFSRVRSILARAAPEAAAAPAASVPLSQRVRGVLEEVARDRAQLTRWIEEALEHGRRLEEGDSRCLETVIQARRAPRVDARHLGSWGDARDWAQAENGEDEEDEEGGGDDDGDDEDDDDDDEQDEAAAVAMGDENDDDASGEDEEREK